MSRFVNTVRVALRTGCLLVIVGIGITTLSAGKASAAECDSAELDKMRSNTLLGLPTWYKYLPGEKVEQRVPTRDDSGYKTEEVCQPTIKNKGNEKLPINNILLIVAAVLEILVRVAGLAAFVFLIYGGFMYLTSNGNSENVGKAGSTLLNAAIGLGIAISATAFINFFAGRLAQK